MPTYAAVLSLAPSPGSPKADEATAARELAARAKHLDTRIVVGLGATDDGRLTVQVEASNEAEARTLVDQLSSTGSLELRAVHPDSSQELWDAVKAGDSLLPGFVPYEHHYTHRDGTSGTTPLFLSKRAVIRGQHVQRAEPVADQEGVILVHLDHEGADAMRRATESLELGRDRIAVLFNDEVVSAPVVQGTLGGQFVIQGLRDAERLPLCAALLSPYTANLKLESLKPLAPEAPKP